MTPFSSLTRAQKSLEVLRWLLVPVVAIASAMVVPIALRLLYPPPMARPPGMPPEPVSQMRQYVLPYLAPIVMSLPMIIAGAKTAPRLRVATASVLAALWTVYAFLSYELVHWLHGGPGHTMHFAVAVASGAAAVGLVWWGEKRA